MARLSPSVATVLGHRINLDPTDSLLLSVNGIYEPLETRLVEAVIRPGDVVVDIGAHIGYYTLLAARAAGPGGHVFAFEPERDNFELLQRNVAENGYANVSCENKAVASSAGRETLFISPYNTGDHRIAAADSERERQVVEAVSLDGFFAGRGTAVSVIKMDIQGRELDALEGMRNLLESNEDVLMFTELSPVALEEAGTTVQEFLTALEGEGFDLYEIDEKDETLTSVSADQLRTSSERVEHPDDHTNLACAKGQRATERLAAVIELDSAAAAQASPR
jgi:FkbM family methyltransferase